MERAPTWCLGGHGFDSCQGHSCCLLRGLLSMDNCELLEIFLSKLQYHSNVSYHFSSRFSRDAYRFSRDESRFSREASRFSRESLKHLVWNILYMYYSQEASAHIKDGATILTFKHQQKVRWNVHCKIRCVLIDCSIHVEQIY